MGLYLSELVVIDVLFVLVASFLAVWVYFQHCYKYWEKKGVPYIKPSFPYGNIKVIFKRTISITTDAKDWYDELKSKGHKFGGVYSFWRKRLVLVDPEYIKDILTKDFQHFIDRDAFSNEKDDPKGTHLFNIQSPGWKSLRQKLTPTFTSGKMKMMFDSLLVCSDYMIDYMKKTVQDGQDLDSREILASFTTDVIGSVAFGVECNSFDSSKSDFRIRGRSMFTGNWLSGLRIFIASFSPEISRKLRLRAMKGPTTTFFTEVVRSTLEYRKKNNVRRPDFLQLLLDMHEEPIESEKHVTFNQIVANTILFFIAGFDTSSTTMNFTLYELARNPEIQKKTRDEINTVLAKHDGKITYEALQEMTYLQQVIDEAMRLWPPLITLGRICTKDYILRDTDVVIEKGTSVMISPLGLGRDPEYFPNPEKFDPERFTPEEKAKRHPYIHIPFGEGPRNCIGLRFGLMQSRIGIVRVLTNFKLSISPKTKLPLTISSEHFLLKSNEKLYLRAEKI